MPARGLPRYRFHRWGLSPRAPPYVVRLRLEGKVQHETTARLDRDRLAGGLRGAGGGLLLRVGAEYWLFNILALRGGWNGHGLSAGAGLRLRVNAMSFFVNYAFNTHTLGGSQRISVSGEF